MLQCFMNLVSTMTTVHEHHKLPHPPADAGNGEYNHQLLPLTDHH